MKFYIIASFIYNKFIEDLGYSATVACHDEQLKRLDHSAEVAKYVSFLKEYGVYISIYNFTDLVVGNIYLYL